MIDDLSAARLRVAKIEADIAEMTGLLGGAAVQVAAAPAVASAPLEKKVLPFAAPVAPPEPIWEEPPIDLAGEDNMGPGRFV